jgi:hypothetical protein
MNEENTLPLNFLSFQIPNIISILNISNEIISNETENILSNLERLSNLILCCNERKRIINESNFNKNENGFKKEVKKKTYFTVSQTK